MKTTFQRPPTSPRNTPNGRPARSSMERPSTHGLLKTSRWQKSRRCAPANAFRYNHAHDGRDEILTLQDVIDIAKRASAEFGRTIGIYPETKHPSCSATSTASRGKARRHPQGQRLRRPRRTVLHPVLRIRQPATSAHDDRHADRSSSWKPRTASPTTSSSPATRAPTATSPAPRSRKDRPLRQRHRPEQAPDRPGQGRPHARRADHSGRRRAPRRLARPPYTFRDEAIFLAPDYAGDPQAVTCNSLPARRRRGVLGFADSAFRARSRFLREMSPAP